MWHCYKAQPKWNTTGDKKFHSLSVKQFTVEQSCYVILSLCLTCSCSGFSFGNGGEVILRLGFGCCYNMTGWWLFHVSCCTQGPTWTKRSCWSWIEIKFEGLIVSRLVEMQLEISSQNIYSTVPLFIYTHIHWHQKDKKKGIIAKSQTALCQRGRVLCVFVRLWVCAFVSVCVCHVHIQWLHWQINTWINKH